jgi:uncharacterized protein YbjT (DUF2867 family)
MVTAHERHTLRVLVIGASGGTGRELVTQALAGGHDVGAFVRDAQRLPIQSERLTCHTGDIMDAQALSRALVGQEAVCCALGTMPETRSERHRQDRHSTVCSRGTSHLLVQMQAQGVARLVVETSAAVGESRTHGRYGAAWVIRRVLAPVMADKDVQEAAVRASLLKWTIVRPVRLTFGPRTNQCRAAPDLPYTLWSRISRADVAALMLDAATNSRWVGQAVTVAA